MTHEQTIEAVIENLKGLFRDKDRLVGVDDWDTFIGCICALEKVKQALTIVEQENKEE